MLTFCTEVDRRLALCIIIPLLLCAVLVVIATTGTARLEFGYSIWIRKTSYLPKITEVFRDCYQWGAILPVGLSLWSFALTRKPRCKLGALTLFVATEALLLTGWVLFAVLSFYLSNQAFFFELQ
jgi:hypothetical protein